MTALVPGASFAGYRIESVIGRGGMGVVYRATDLSLQRPVALKLVAPELAQDERFRSRFLKEPRIAASLDHPNVVPIHEAGEHDGRLFLAMRFVDGSDLRTLIEREGSLSVERALRILAQIADALDAAHRRGLVHRDVKPGNVLLDEDGHAYLTDFGITKQVGSDSTQTGEIVGTLDYLAPEQIRSEAVDGRTDVYALACVLYECLAGVPPFRRATQMEAIWAHLQEPPPPLPGHPELDPVLATGLAKEREERHSTCSALIEAARAPLAPAAPTLLRRSPVGPRLLRRRRGILAAGAVVLAATVAAAVVSLTGGEEAAAIPVESGVAAIGGDGRIRSFTDAATAPSNIAVGEGAVWVLNTEARTVSRIDPETGRITDSFKTGGIPSDIAAGAGAIWVGSGGGRENNATQSISRIDPATKRITRTVKLPGAGAFFGSPSNGFPTIAVGAGAVWASTPANTIARIDPRTGKRVATVEIATERIAAGEEGLWVTSSDRPSSVIQIDPRTNGPGQRIDVGADLLTGIAVGAGSVWAAAQNEGLVWRVEPGPRPVYRSIDVGPGVSFIAFGAGAVWAANYATGTVTRIDPRTNAVTATVPIGAAQSLAAGEGAAWVSVAGAPRDGTLPVSACGAIASGGRTPDLLVASDAPLQGPRSATPRAVAEAIGLVFRQRGYRAGRFTVGYQSCDDSTAQSGDYDLRRCAANANAYARADKVVAVIGPYNSPCARVAIPILNRAPGGPVPMISSSNSYPGLTRAGLPAPNGYRGEPDIFYPTGVRNYVRLGTRDSLAGTALAMLSDELGLKSVYLLHDDSGFFKVLLSDPFRRAAKTLGIRIAGAEQYHAATKDFDALVERVARSGADGVTLGGAPWEDGGRLLKALRARLGRRVTIMGGFFFQFVEDVLKAAGRDAHGVYWAATDVPGSVRETKPPARRFARDLGTPGSAPSGALEAAQAAEVLLDAIARSDGTRASLLARLRAAKVQDGILGSFRFDRHGDIVPGTIMIGHITGATAPGGKALEGEYAGAVLHRLVKVPPSLSG